jgi:ubiquinone/menaquinone biosynthesis C-methylase UbiE
VSTPKFAEDARQDRQELMRQYDVASYYRAFRPGIPQDLADVLVAAVTRDGEAETLLDLGTGTGQMVAALHPYFRDIIAVDPSEGLLEQAEEDLRPRLAPGTTLRLAQARGEDYVPPEGWTASLVTICRAVHWMDHQVLLDGLARIVRASGVVALVQDAGFWRTPTPWKELLMGVVQDFLGSDHTPLKPLESLDWSYGEILAESAFSDVEQLVVPVRRVRDVDSVLGFLYSNSYAGRPRFGDRIDEFESEVRRVLLAHSGSDTFAEDDEFTVILGRKP